MSHLRLRHSILEELKTTTPASLGMASWPIRVGVLVMWVVLIIACGERWVFDELGRHLIQQQNERADLDHSLRVTQQAIEKAQAEQVKHEQILESLQAQYANLGPLRPASDWLATAGQLASELGLADLSASSNEVPINPLPWLEATRSNPHLQALTMQSFSVDLTGHWATVLAWLDAVMQHERRGRVWLHQVQFTRAPNSSSSSGLLYWRGQIVLSHVGLSPKPIPDEAFLVDRTIPPSWTNALGHASWGRGIHALDWWQALPLSRLTLIGVGQMAGRQWAWVLDPRGAVHRVFVNQKIARPTHRVVSIDANGVSLINEMTSAPFFWVVGESG